MRKVISLILFTFLISFVSNAKGQVSYKVGEKMFYSIRYGIITGGTASVELTRDQFNDMEVWHSVLFAKTTGLTDAIFRVRDKYESFMDPSTELPVKSIRNIREGRYKKYNEVLFDHRSRRDSAILMSDLTGRHMAQANIQDILSCFYYFRNHILPGISTMKKGDVSSITTWFCDELYPIRLKYVGTDEVKTKAGKVECYKFNPVTEKGRLFNTEEGVSFWFSADKNFLPVKIQFDIFVGSFTVELESYEGLMYPLEIKKK